jgi:hypothetical protein
MPTDVSNVKRQVERALAYAHAALDENSASRVVAARMYAESVLPRVAEMKPRALAMSDAQQLMDRVRQLRALMKVLDRALEAQVSIDGEKN